MHVRGPFQQRQRRFGGLVELTIGGGRETTATRRAGSACDTCFAHAIVEIVLHKKGTLPFEGDSNHQEILEAFRRQQIQTGVLAGRLCHGPGRVTRDDAQHMISCSLTAHIVPIAALAYSVEPKSR